MNSEEAIGVIELGNVNIKCLIFSVGDGITPEILSTSIIRSEGIHNGVIVNLSKAAERFGKGDYIEKFRPSGALEIRQAGHEFDRMRKRITRHLNQRSEMLSGISHDLRTPLTRLKLQLSFLKDKEI